jgi:hypothetical protein
MEDLHGGHDPASCACSSRAEGGPVGAQARILVTVRTEEGDHALPCSAGGRHDAPKNQQFTKAPGRQGGGAIEAADGCGGVLVGADRRWGRATQLGERVLGQLASGAVYVLLRN